MTKRNEIEQQKEFIVSKADRHMEGVGISELLADPELHLEKRTLQRRLLDLVSGEKLLATGQGPSRRYKIPREEDVAEGYDPKLLEEYEPNKSFYLSESDREQMRIFGTPLGEEGASANFARDIVERLGVDLVWASSYLEGEECTLDEIRRLLTIRPFAEGKTAAETLGILNHQAATEELLAGNISLNEEIFQNIHAILVDGLVPPSACGRTRTQTLKADGRDQAESPLGDLDERLSKILKKADKIGDPFEQAFFILVHLSYLAPYEQMNGPVARLAANIPLIRNNLCPISYIGVLKENFDEAVKQICLRHSTTLLREFFLDAYERSCREYLGPKFESASEEIFRLHFRSTISDAVKLTVLEKTTTIDEEESVKKLNSLMPSSVPPWAKDRWVRTLMEELRHLDMRNSLRFGLQKNDIYKWKREVSRLSSAKATRKPWWEG